MTGALPPAVVVALAALPGIALLLLWWRGRLALDDPYCGACGHPLRGATTMPTRCAECGREFRRIGAVRFARRVRVHWIAPIGVAVLLAGPASTLAYQRWRAANPATAPVAAAPPARPAKPRAATQQSIESAMSDEAIVAAIDGAQEPTAVSHWGEAAVRMQQGRFDDAEIESLVAAIERLAVQQPPSDQARRGDRSTRIAGREQLHDVAADLGAALAGSSRLTEAQRRRLIKAWFGDIGVGGSLRTSVGARASLGWSAVDATAPTRRLDPALAGPHRAVRLLALRVDGQPVAPAKDARGVPVLPELPPGDHVVELDLEWVALTASAEVVEALNNDAGWSPIASADGSSTGRFAALFAPTDELPESERAAPRRLARGIATVERVVPVRGPDQPLLDPLDKDELASQRATLSQARIESAVVRPVGGPGKRTLQVRVVHSAPGEAAMLGRLVVKVGDRRIESAPKLIFIKGAWAQVRKDKPQVLFEIDEAMDALPSDVGTIEAFIEPVATIPGVALDLDRGFNERIDLPRATLRRADLGE